MHGLRRAAGGRDGQGPQDTEEALQVAAIAMVSGSRFSARHQPYWELPAQQASQVQRPLS